MPQHRTIKNVIVEGLVFFGLLASLGHMTVNFWERFMIQSELVHMKTSLHSLKETITNIGAAYDSLHKELKNLLEFAEKKQHQTRFKNVEKPIRPAQPLLPVSKPVVLKLDKTVRTEPNVDDKATEKKYSTKNKKLEALVNTKSLNAATITSNPPKSIGVGDTHKDSEYKKDIYSINEPHECLYSPEYKYCRRRNQYPYHNWRV